MVGTITIINGSYIPLLSGCCRIVDCHSNLVMVNRDGIRTLTGKESETQRD